MKDSSRELLSGSRLRLEALTKKQQRGPEKPTNALEKLADDDIQKAQAAGSFNDLEGAGQPQQTRTPINARLVSTIAEQRIEAAIRDGQFDNLEGAGKPLNLNDDAHVPADFRMAFRLMKGKDFETPWADALVQYQRKRNDYEVWLRNNRQDWDALPVEQQHQRLQELPAKLKDLNDLIHAINATVPNDSMRLGLLVLKREQQRLQGVL